MPDYIEEVNTALSTRGESFYYDSMENVKKSLELEKEDYQENAKKYTGLALGIAGSGVFGWMNPELYSNLTEQMESISQNELAAVGLTATLGFSVLPAYAAKKNRDKANQVDRMISDIEERNFDEEAAEFAYKIADELSE